MSKKTAIDITSKKRQKKRKKKRLIIFSIALLIIVVVVMNLIRPSTPDDIKGSTAKVEFGGVLDRLTEMGLARKVILAIGEGGVFRPYRLSTGEV